MTVVCLMTHQMAQTWEDAIKLKGFLGDLSWGAGTAIFDGIKNSKEFSFSNTHIWDFPSPRRYYF